MKNKDNKFKIIQSIKEEIAQLDKKRDGLKKELEKLKQEADTFQVHERKPEYQAGKERFSFQIKVPSESNKQLLNVRQLAEKLQISQSKVRNLYQTGQIPFIKISYRNVRFDLDEVLKALEKQ